jgi:NAD(P)-dependent dehydrogenase (short-subunit alcohol dehydrogenase family)
MAPKWTTDNIPSQEGRTFLITGANSGVGLGAAKAIAKKGGALVLAVRNVSKGELARKEILQESKSAKIELMPLDLSDLDSVKRFSDEFKQKHQQLDVLFNNAGMTNGAREVTRQGFEAHWGTNHLGPFALTAYLLPVLLQTPQARIVTVASFVPKLNRVTMDWNDLQYEKRKYDAMAAYGQSKLANILFALALDKRLKQHGSTVLSVLSSPGYTKSGIQQSQGLLIQLMTLVVAQGVEMGMLPSLRAAFDPTVQGGEFFSPVKMKEMRGYPERITIPEQALEEEDQQKLWRLSEEMTQTHVAWASLLQTDRSPR